MTDRKESGALYFWKFAVLVVVFFGCVHMIGFREHTSVWAGTQSESTSHIAGLMYIFLYLSTVICVPVWCMTDFVLWILNFCKK